MKKILSTVFALCIVLMSTMTAFAQEQALSEKIDEKINGAVAYLTNGVASYGADEAVDFAILASSGADVSAFKDDFISNIKSNLDANAGKIVSSYGENMATYAGVIIALNALGEDFTDFYGYNISDALLSLDPTVAPASLNYYLTIAQALSLCDGADSFLVDLCDTYAVNYTMGSGVDYYGFSCDNTAYFVGAVSYGLAADDKYLPILEDAISVIEQYKVDGGYCYNPAYGTDANADSTALALMANCLYRNAISQEPQSILEVTTPIYNDLCTFEGSQTGVFTFAGADSAYSTKEALISMIEFKKLAVICENNSVSIEEITTNKIDVVEDLPKPAIEKESTTEPATQKENDVVKSPATGSPVLAVSALTALLAAGIITAKKRK